MQRSKSLLLLLIFVSVMIVTFMVVGGRSSSDDEARGEEPSEEELLDVEDSLDTNSSKGENYRGFVAEPSILLDEDTQKHLTKFRDEVAVLADSYPDTFITCNPTSKRLIALTFDDGPDEITTPEILEILDGYNIPATFFFIGTNVERFPDICKMTEEFGHQIASHSFSHPRPTESSVQAVLDEFESSSTLLGVAPDEDIRYIRPPYGLVTKEQLLALKERNFKIIGWSIDSMDWYTDNREEIVEAVLSSVHPGAIVLMHSAGGADNRRATVEALPIIIENLKHRGYTFVTIEELLDSP